ncbi:MAG: hypothetical protein ABIS36_20005 [Chryseolinea sp.]
MPSIVSSYSFDVFISYRQKDNKYDSWVTEFVSNLSKELEAVSKSEVSIYFDVNPHDGLTETHDVDLSLKEKIKCLIFIPIISKTYCDFNCFAWKNEFLPFCELASNDRFGLKVSVSNGDVASRILPIRIHDIDPGDLALFEKEINGRIRAIDFVYRSSGVNRPLRSIDDKLEADSHRVLYRNQINKVANGVIELLRSMTQSEVAIEPVVSRPTPVPTKPAEKRMTISRFVLLSFLVIAVAIGLFVFMKKESPLLPAELTIAVIPFRTLSSDENQKYFSYGIMEDIISKLYKLSNLQVTSGTSAFTYQNTAKTANEIALELGVTYILEGSVRRDGDRVRISARLIHADKDKALWSETFDEELDNLFALQTKVADRIVDALQIKLSSHERTQFEKENTTNTLAFEFYQQGKFFNELSGPDNLKKSNNFFLKAIETDSTYAAAYAGLAESEISAIEWGYSNPNDAAPRIFANITKAISIDSTLGEAYSALGAYHTYCSHNFDEASKAFEKGIKFNPGYDFNYFHYSVLEVIRQHQAKSLTLSDKAIMLNPLSVKSNVYRIQKCYYMFGDYDKGAIELNKILEIFPNDNFALWVQGTIETQRKNYSAAIDAFLKRSVASKHTNWALGYTYAVSGQENKAREILKFLLEKEKTIYVSPTFIACIYIGLKENDKALDYLERAAELNDYWTIYFGLDPWLDPVRGDPRFNMILEQMKLKQKDQVSIPPST